MKTPTRPGRSAFTLIEMMTVIAIIMLLAGIVVSGLSYVKEKQRRDTAKVQIALLSKAIEEYKMDMGTYPGTPDTAADGDVSEQLYQALFKDGYDYASTGNPAGWTKATTIYLPELDPRSSKQGWVTPSAAGATPPANLKILDPWKKNYRYRIGSNSQSPDFDLWSIGEDGTSGTKDDIRNY